ncbi:aldehyde dehydrogenase [Clostridium sp. MB40-C1]|uniref:aldehyde dehydrogenase n=1 Tax=Clostridium sp. MB40-C1 TaxID=3070996 RepID=UPI0027DF205E|nr:aldehyde dehydrogenase [Clostridium sp. MB40-C1]WMJ80211.1 aldehyde dehydrogenase [Clostridium sp. MB40-C1]
MESIKELINIQREYFHTGETKSVDFRIQQLRKLKASILKYEVEICEALNKDLYKSEFESYATEVGITLDEINLAIKKVKRWAKAKKARTPITNFLASSYIYSEPYGVTLIISPWNYPFQLLMAPLVGSIAAGNCSVLKPSEYTKNTSCIINKIIEETFEKKFIAIINGGIEASTAILKEKFDYIFFTGSVEVGRMVMEAAAKNLTPLTLELGGKSPCIVDKDVDIKLAARRIAWGKFLNAGQTCVAPDYLLVHKDVKIELLDAMKKVIKEFFGDNPKNSPDLPRIVSERHFDRLKDFLKKGHIIIGGEYNKDNLYISPTIIDNINWETPIMQEEIFGPILPIMEYENISEVINVVNEHAKPLAVYIFSKNKRIQKHILKSIPFGGGCINDTIMHVASTNIPFGGVGNSGIGHYHGKASFDTFSHKKSVVNKSNLIDISLRYPPYKDKVKLLKRIFK